MQQSSEDPNESSGGFWTRRKLLGALAGGGLGAGGIWYTNRRVLNNPSRNKIVPPSEDSPEKFGEKQSVAVSDDGTTTIIGAPDKSTVYIFSQANGEWTQRARVTRHNLLKDLPAAETVETRMETRDLGRSVAISGDGTTAIVGAAPDLLSEWGGTGFVFTLDEEGWSHQATLRNEDAPHFGRSVAISGDGSTAMVGAPESGYSDQGMVHVYSRAGEEWKRQTRLAADDGEKHDAFGHAVALSSDGSTANIGAKSDDNQNGERAGAAYVFQQTSGGWTQQVKLFGSYGGFLFGRRVAVSGDGTIALVGDIQRKSASDPCAVFEQDDEGWVQRANFDMVGPTRYYDFAVSDTGRTIIVIGFHEDNSDAVYVFGRTEKTVDSSARTQELWELRSKIHLPDGLHITKSASVAISGDGTTAIGGAHQDYYLDSAYSVELE